MSLINSILHSPKKPFLFFPVCSPGLPVAKSVLQQDWIFRRYDSIKTKLGASFRFLSLDTDIET